PGSRTDHEGLGPGPMHRGESLIRRTDTTWLQPCVVRGRPAPGPDPAEAARDARVGHRTQRKACTEVSVSTTATDSPALVSTRTTSVAVVPVVNTSSRTTTSAPGGGRPAGTRWIRPARFAARRSEGRRVG